MKVTPIKTRPMKPPQDNLFEVLSESIKELPEKSVLVITSKIVAIHQGRCIKRDDSVDERQLIIDQADKYLSGDESRKRPMLLTIKDNLFTPKAGIDTSNANGYYILWPEDVDQFTHTIHQFIRQTYQTKEFGVLVIDSGLLPLRWGTVGISLSHAGFCPLIDYRDKKDIFGKLSMSVVLANVADSLASAANLVMGEGNEQTPLALIEDIPFVTFGESSEEMPSLQADMKEDLFAEMIDSTNWKTGGGGK